MRSIRARVDVESPHDGVHDVLGLEQRRDAGPAEQALNRLFRELLVDRAAALRAVRVADLDLGEAHSASTVLRASP